MKYFKKHTNGFTLVEALVGTLIATVVVGTIFAIFAAGNDLWEIKRTQADLQGQARVAVDQITTELKQATRTSTLSPSPNIVFPTTPDNRNIMFYLPADLDSDGKLTNNATGSLEWDTTNPIQYSYNSTSRQIVRSQNSVDKILCNNVLDIRYIDITYDTSLYINELKVVLSLSKTTPRGRTMSTVVSAGVKLRN